VECESHAVAHTYDSNVITTTAKPASKLSSAVRGGLAAQSSLKAHPTMQGSYQETEAQAAINGF
jgi:hypothetical protein